MKSNANLWLRIKTFLSAIGASITLLFWSFIGIFIPVIHKWLNEFLLTVMRKMVRKFKKVRIRK